MIAAGMRKAEPGNEQAQVIERISEEALRDMQALLVELRPAGLDGAGLHWDRRLDRGDGPGARARLGGGARPHDRGPERTPGAAGDAPEAPTSARAASPCAARGVGLTVDEIGRLWPVAEGAQPFQQLGWIGMIAELF